MAEETDFSVEIAEFLNSEFGGDFSKLQDAENILKRIGKTEEELNAKLPEFTEGAVQHAAFHKTANTTLQNITNLQQQNSNLQKLTKSEIEALKPISDDFTDNLDEIKQLEKAYNYLQWVFYIEKQNDMLEEAAKEEVSYDMTTHFLSLKEIWTKLKMSKCKNLVIYSENTMLYWFNILKEKFEKEFLNVLSSLNWPFLRLSPSLKTPPSDAMTKFKCLFNTLLDIQLPDDFSGPANDNQSYLLPLQLMFEPLRKRFLFHFMSNKQTNKIEKPEWYLAQILTWISDHAVFLNDIVQPLIVKRALTELALDELMRFLVQLAMMRLQKDLPILLNESHLLRHTIDEVFLFEQELRNLDYPSVFPSIFNVLLTEPCFSHWKSLEHKSALYKMDRILNSDTAWKFCYQDEGYLDELKIPECAEAFITLLLSMTERFKHLPDVKHQLIFLELQLEILDDFRLRLHQLSQYQVEEALDQKYCAILNALNYVVMILNEWSNFPFFLKLHANMQKKKSHPEPEPKSMKLSRIGESKDDDESLEGSVFDEVVLLLEHMLKDLLNALCEKVMLDIKAKSRPYRKEKWFCMSSVLDKKVFEVSPLAYPLLDVISNSLQGLRDRLAKMLFTSIWQQMARELNEYLFEEVVLQNSFNERGAEQLNFDMTRNLFPIFGMYTLKPENYFKLVKESCILLTLMPAPAMLLKETLKQNENVGDQQLSALAELGVHTLKPSQALVILSQRNDISM